MAFLGFKGEYKHTLDLKNRIFIPAKYRPALGEMFTITYAPFEYPGLYVFPDATWNELCVQLDEMEVSEEGYWQRREFARHADDFQMDKQGRITITQEFCDYAQLKNDVLLVGNMKHIEIWNPEIFEKAYAAAKSKGVVSSPTLKF